MVILDQELKDKFQLFGNTLQQRLIERYGDVNTHVAIQQSPSGEFVVTMIVEGKRDSYTVYQNKIDSKYYFIRNFNGVM